MKYTILLDKYLFLWKERNENVIIAEIRHYIKNGFGGTLETVIGNLVCYKEYRPVHWRVKVVLREDIKYSQTQNQVFVFTKSAYKRKLNLYFAKLKDFVYPRFKAEKELDIEIKKHLLENNWISKPFSISRSIEKSENFEFIGKIEEFDHT
ncbi:hypothetical protein [Mangrovimonas sp. TPBH4]|uniref:hypothetical protein n=1 Tax=Mangrovimonas sp. TPBH4 TaxID=1645914 RepID=UPI000A428B0C|nr:hypothetical protein [Mangrovimonas sp. TPBH4]